MLLFCPTCGNVLIVEEGQKCMRFACNTCPYVHNITRKVSWNILARKMTTLSNNHDWMLYFSQVNNRKYPKLKEVDDVLGGAAAWENVDSTAGESLQEWRVQKYSREGLINVCLFSETCPKCEHPRAYFMQIQTRSADEPMTTFYKCCNAQCGHRWREWHLKDMLQLCLYLLFVITQRTRDFWM